MSYKIKVNDEVVIEDVKLEAVANDIAEEIKVAGYENVEVVKEEE